MESYFILRTACKADQEITQLVNELEGALCSFSDLLGR
jgi:hypothetical protein